MDMNNIDFNIFRILIFNLIFSFIFGFLQSFTGSLFKT